MTDFVAQCSNCSKFIELDDFYTEERNMYGFPVFLCEECQNTNSNGIVVQEYSRVPNCSWGSNKNQNEETRK